MADIPVSASISTLARQLDVEKVPRDSGSPKENSPETRSTREESQLSAANDEAEPQRQVTGFRWLLVCLAIFSGNIL